MAPSPPVHVANRVDVKLEGQTLVTTATPLCARASTGEYVVINETRRDKDGSKWGAAAGLAIGIGELTTAHYLWDTDYRVVGAMMLGFGSLMTLLGVTNLALPSRLETEHPPDRYRAATIATSNWEPCAGSKRAISTPLDLKITGGSDSWTWRAITRTDGTFELPSELAAWASSCNVEVDSRCRSPTA